MGIMECVGSPPCGGAWKGGGLIGCRCVGRAPRMKAAASRRTPEVTRHPPLTRGGWELWSAWARPRAGKLGRGGGV
ncbi:MAG: hypothetical protein FWH21_09535, partial [Kiritimatiellaeota bacterium]|nr:hypothetical protein [Kiritimatiellota bacterium]